MVLSIRMATPQDFFLVLGHGEQVVRLMLEQRQKLLVSVIKRRVQIKTLGENPEPKEK
jgi:hypothetical protein